MPEKETHAPKDPISALNLALERERHAFNLYSTLRDSVEDDAVKRLMTWLANEEKTHIQKIQDELDQHFYREN